MKPTKVNSLLVVAAIVVVLLLLVFGMPRLMQVLQPLIAPPPPAHASSYKKADGGMPVRFEAYCGKKWRNMLHSLIGTLSFTDHF